MVTLFTDSLLTVCCYSDHKYFTICTFHAAWTGDFVTYFKASLVCLFVAQQIRREKIREEIKLTRLCAFLVDLDNTSST